MTKFALVSKYKDCVELVPKRGTSNSAGYDLFVAEDITIPAYKTIMGSIENHVMSRINMMDVLMNKRAAAPRFNLDEVAILTKELKAKPTLVSTGVKCYLEPDEYLELTLRSSTPLKYWLIMANSQGIIDSDYVDNSSNEGEILLQLINLFPYDITLHKGDCIGQGIIKKYLTTDDDAAYGIRDGGFGSTSSK